jgi:hypothetical protein
MGAFHSPRCQVCPHDQRWRIELLRAGGPRSTAWQISSAFTVTPFIVTTATTSPRDESRLLGRVRPRPPTCRAYCADGRHG